MNRKDKLYKRLREVEKAMENYFITNEIGRASCRERV